MGILDIFKGLSARERAQKSVIEKGFAFADKVLRGYSRRSLERSEAFPRYPYGYENLIKLAQASDTLTTIHVNLRKELTRNGLELVEAKKTDSETTTSEDNQQALQEKRQELLEFSECCNQNKQTIQEVMGEVEDDVNTVDDGWAQFVISWAHKLSGDIDFESSELQEVIRLHPATMGFVLNKYDEPAKDDSGRQLYFDPEDRTHLSHEERNKDGKELLLAYYVQTGPGGNSASDLFILITSLSVTLLE